MSDIDDPAARGFASICRAEGEFSLLLDDQFVILWHTSSLTGVLGYESIVGRNGMEFIHPDDLQLVVDLIARFGAADTNGESVMPSFRPDPSDVRILAASGEWIAHNSVVFDHTTDPTIRGLLVNCRVVVDRSDIALSIELLGTGAPVEEVLSMVARLADRGLGGDSRCTVAWWHGDEIRVTWSPEPPTPHPLMAAAASNAVRMGMREATIIMDFDDPVLMGAGTPARELGFTAAYLTPIVASDGVEVIGCLLAWGHHAIELTVYPRADSRRPAHRRAGDRGRPDQERSSVGGVARPADIADQPRRVRASTRRDGRLRGAALHRPRRLQAGQRRARPFGRRCRVGRSGGADTRDHRPGQHRRAPRRRRVRGGDRRAPVASRSASRSPTVWSTSCVARSR